MNNQRLNRSNRQGEEEVIQKLHFSLRRPFAGWKQKQSNETLQLHVWQLSVCRVELLFARLTTEVHICCQLTGSRGVCLWRQRPLRGRREAAATMFVMSDLLSVRFSTWAINLLFLSFSVHFSPPLLLSLLLPPFCSSSLNFSSFYVSSLLFLPVILFVHQLSSVI